MANLITLQDAKSHLRIAGTADDYDVSLKVAQASADVREYITRDDADWQATIAAWTPTTAPLVVQAATLECLMDLWRFRGDDLEQPEGKPRWQQRLDRVRDPVVA